MAGCCDPHGCDQMFGAGFARYAARRFRRRGLDTAARQMVDFLAADGVAGATVLDIGGGVGEIGIELLRRGAASATTLELSPAYDVEARRLAEEAGVAGRAYRHVTDIAADADDVEPADVVVLHRVVCCYPDFERLLGAAADLCRGRLAFSHPPRNVATRAVVAAQNATSSLLGREYRAFAHPPTAMVGAVEARGMRQVLTGSGMVWQVAALVR
ncbi:methyltransferase domain-containing protein [Georgenia satyanarayanai]|uniref:methyltransferase domain-containing protein n=1 Tax=Georgenia satyanarayanai TaxID=860221 RepID=UPI00203A907C|nr:methyltransferase domain-containing protein [Georgenia satyanarayanai]MCM3659438.1 methyltransferase domain-containing protein [Georgenia satyanarayanai]